MKENISEQHPNFPSGEWEGFYKYANYGRSRDQMQIHLNFQGGKVYGSGTDSIGAFSWIGEYDSTKETCVICKIYSSHNVSYKGVVDENGIYGTWIINQNWFGEFHIWPKKNEAETAENELHVNMNTSCEVESGHV